jgi:hypothetical protein
MDAIALLFGGYRWFRSRIVVYFNPWMRPGTTPSVSWTWLPRARLPRTKAIASSRLTWMDARDNLAAAKAELAAAEAQRGAAGDANAAVKAAQAALGQAQLDLEHTRIRTPAAGTIGELDLRPGNFVTAGRDLFALVETDEVWVEANFKETDLPGIRPGQPARVTVDLVAGQILRGPGGEPQPRLRQCLLPAPTGERHRQLGQGHRGLVLLAVAARLGPAGAKDALLLVHGTPAHPPEGHQLWRGLPLARTVRNPALRWLAGNGRRLCI